MAKYGGVVYKGAYYGEAPRTPFSVEPFTATAVDYDRILLTWNNPTGDLTGIRLVRNQEGFGECPEDGVILFERNGSPSTFGGTTYLDGVDNFLDDNPLNDISLVSGRWVYYRMWVRRGDNLWTIANDVYLVLPKNHGTSLPDGTELQSTQSNFMDMLPRVYSSREQSPLGTVDSTSTLYDFLSAMSFTLDEMLTLSDLLLPDYAGRNYGPGILELKTAEYGLAPEESDAIVRKKRMAREAFYMYNRKGTELALGTMIESLTGYAPTITYSPNLFLSNQDSTFNKGTGFWRTIGDGTLEVVDNVRTPDTEPKSIDYYHCGKVTVGSAGLRLENGTYRTVTRGIPVENNKEYEFSIFVRTASGSEDDVSLSIRWYDRRGELISSAFESFEGVTTSWQKLSMTAVSPGFSSEAVSYSVASDLVTLTFAEAHEFSVNQVVTVSGIGNEFDGMFTVYAVTPTTLSFLLDTDDVVETLADISVYTTTAAYAAVTVNFVQDNTYYIDLAKFSESQFTEYEEARGVNIFLDSSKENWLPNPSFHEDGTPWTLGEGITGVYTQDSTLPYIYAGSKMLSTTNIGAALETNISTTTDSSFKAVNKSYTFSVYLQVPADPLVVASYEDISLELIATDGENTVSSVSDVVRVESEWVRPYVELFVPANFDANNLSFTAKVNLVAANASTLNLDAAQLEEGYIPSDYFDGSFPAEYGVTWSGEPYESSSHCYKIKQVKIIRLIQELENFLPSNTPYVVSSHAGIEVTGITL